MKVYISERQLRIRSEMQFIAGVMLSLLQLYFANNNPRMVRF